MKAGIVKLVGAVALIGSCAAHSSAAESEAPAVAADAADVATRVCFGAVSGAVTLQDRDFASFERNVREMGLEVGIPSGIFDTIGPAGQGLLNRATVAHRISGGYVIQLAAGGSMPNCRVLVVGAAAADLPASVTSALAAPAAGWTPLPQTQRDLEGGAKRQRFIRRDAANRPYLLDALAIVDPQRRLRMALIVSPWPSDVALPEGEAGADGGFMAAANTYGSCLRAAVELGMRLRIDPSGFQRSFATACLGEERAFRTEAVRRAMRLGRSEAGALAEVDGNIASGRAIFAAEQASYHRTGQVPR